MTDKESICCETCNYYWSSDCTGKVNGCDQYEEYDAKASEYYYFGERTHDD